MVKTTTKHEIITVFSSHHHNKSDKVKGSPKKKKGRERQQFIVHLHNLLFCVHYCYVTHVKVKGQVAKASVIHTQNIIIHVQVHIN